MDNTKIFACIAIFLVSFLAFSYQAKAAYGPRAYVSEYVSQDYWWNGTAKAADIRRGQVEVSVPNNWDVLQYLRVNVTPWQGNTNIANIFYDNVVTSYPTTDSKDPIYANITGNAQATYYNITNISASPTLNLSLTVANMAGGTDIYDSDNIGAGGSTNTLRFNLSIRNPSADVALSGVTLILQFRQDSGGGTRDAVNITNSTLTASSGSVDSSDPQTDSDWERITWTGSIGASGLVYIVFNATLLEGAGLNINAGDNSVNLDSNDKGVLGNFSAASTLSGVSITYKLTRGPVRQGVDMQISNGYWYVRGLMRNMANDSLTSGQPLTYNITEWRIYSINPATGAPYADANLTGEFNQSASSSELDPADGVIYTNDLSRSSTTSWWNTSSTGKPYIAAYFDWYVLWNATGADNYLSYINTTLDMQTLYKVDFQNTNSLSGVIYPNTGNQVLTIMDNATYTGSASVGANSGNGVTNIGVGNIVMYSIVPANNSAGDHHGVFNIDDPTVKVYFVNDTNQYQLAGNGNVNWSVTEPVSYGANGTVRVSIADLSSAQIVEGGTVGKNITDADEKIMLVFDVISNALMTTGDTYIFTGNTTFTTTSGTADSEAHANTKTIQVSSKRLTGYKDLWVPDPSQPTRVNSRPLALAAASKAT